MRYYASYDIEPFNGTGSYFETVEEAWAFLDARPSASSKKVVDLQTGKEVLR